MSLTLSKRGGLLSCVWPLHFWWYSFKAKCTSLHGQGPGRIQRGKDLQVKCRGTPCKCCSTPADENEWFPDSFRKGPMNQSFTSSFIHAFDFQEFWSSIPVIRMDLTWKKIQVLFWGTIFDNPNIGRSFTASLVSWSLVASPVGPWPPEVSESGKGKSRSVRSKRSKATNMLHFVYRCSSHIMIYHGGLNAFETWHVWIVGLLQHASLHE